jgi:hypothetical protein
VLRKTIKFGGFQGTVVELKLAQNMAHGSQEILPRGTGFLQCAQH